MGWDLEAGPVSWMAENNCGWVRSRTKIYRLKRGRGQDAARLGRCQRLEQFALPGLHKVSTQETLQCMVDCSAHLGAGAELVSGLGSRNEDLWSKAVHYGIQSRGQVLLPELPSKLDPGASCCTGWCRRE